MKRHTGYLIGVVAALLIVASACGSGPDGATVRVSGEPSSSVNPGEIDQGDRTAVGDSESVIRGSFSEKDQDERRRRVAFRVVDEKLFGDPDNADAETRARILDALAVLDPVEVHDDDGRLTGYLTTRFVSVADYPEARTEAQQQLERHSLAP